MSLRDYFAGQALAGLCAHVVGATKMDHRETGAEANARLAYSYADAMLAQRDR